MVITFVVTLAAAIISGFPAAFAAALGGMTGVLANTTAAYRSLRVVDKTNPVLSLRSLAAGEALKFVVVVLLFALIFTLYREIAVLPLFAGFISTFFVYWLALLKQGILEKS